MAREAGAAASWIRTETLPRALRRSRPLKVAAGVRDVRTMLRHDGIRRGRQVTEKGESTVSPIGGCIIVE